MSLIRWHWRTTATENTPLRYELHLDHLYVRGDDLHPEGHQLTLSWLDPHYPAEMRRVVKQETFITEQFRRNAAVVRAQGVAGVPFWEVPVSDTLTVQVALATPEQRFGDNMNEEPAFRVSYQNDGQRWYVARVNPGAGMSQIMATELLT
jgi:hypothetical protein